MLFPLQNTKKKYAKTGIPHDRERCKQKKINTLITKSVYVIIKITK